MIIYFADREMRVLGHATTQLREGYVIIEDRKTEDIETGVASFSCGISFDKENRAKLEEMTNAGNYLLRSSDGENEFYTIIDTEIDTKNQEIYIYAEDAGLDLINERAAAFEADASQMSMYYINKYIVDSGFEIGINEIPNTVKRQLKWEGESSVTERLASIATQFGGYEISYSFAIKGLEVTHKYINFRKQRGKDEGVQLRLNKEVDRIITTKSVANLATAFVCEGGVPDDADKPITLKGYRYDDGDFYVDNNGTLKSRKAVAKWSRYVWNKEPNRLNGYEGHIVRPYSYNTTSQQELCSHAITELKKYCDMEVNYEVDITRLPEGVKIGDRVNIIDDAGELYLSTRILLLETSVVDQKHTATLGEHIIKKGGIAQKVADLAAEFAKTVLSVERAQNIANAAKAEASEALGQAATAAGEAIAANEAADKAQAAAEAAKASAVTAEAQALAAEAAVDRVEASVQSIQTSVEEAQAAADNAGKAAETAEAKATEAATAASNAEADAAEAATAAGAAQTASESAVTKADQAISTAGEAKATAQSASDTAAAAKLDAEQAEKDVEAFGENLETYRATMEADYARKTDLTETESKLQAQITVNAREIQTTIQQVTTIDETANDAKEKAEAAQSAAAAAQEKANQATADAEEAQTTADEAAAAAASAQSEADKAAAAAATAQGVADQAEAALEAAKADLATVQGRVDATEEEIAAAQQAVDTAQAAANQAKADAATAAQTAAAAQNTAATAVENAVNAQSTATNAANAAAAAQALADEAKGDASTAQETADEAARIAAAAQSTADTAVANAASAQAKADQAAADAATAQQAADDADAKAAQAQTDLNTAKQNLADTVARVDATEEEIEAAQAAVEAAQSAADLAQAEAEAAQATADTAKANAATAQQAAGNAKAAADNAQAAADEAQEAADQAQADVNALAIRVTTAETNITQTNERIDLCATKEEFNDLSIGGRNLIKKSQLRCSNCEITASSTDEIIVAGVQSGNLSVLLFDGEYDPGEYVINATGSVSVKSFRLLSDRNIDGNFTLNTYYEGLGYPYFKEVTLPAVFTFAEEKTNLGMVMLTTAGNQTISGLKLEKGNKATDWTPAPEDVTAEMLAEVENVRGQLTEKESSILTTAEGITLQHLEKYTEKTEYETFKETTETTLNVGGAIDMRFKSTEESISSVDGDMQSKFTELYKFITFTENGIQISAGENTMMLELDNDRILFKKNGVQFGWWDGVDFHTGNIVVNVNERAQFGNFAFIPRSDGSLMFLKVGE